MIQGLIYNQEQRCFTKKENTKEDKEPSGPEWGKLTLSIRTRGKYRDRKGRPRYKKKTWSVGLSKGSMDKMTAIKSIEKEFDKPSFKVNGAMTQKKLRNIIQSFK